MPDEPSVIDYASPTGDPRLRRVYGARDGTEAEFVRMLLEQAGIEAVVEGAATDAVLGPVLGAPAAASVWVPEAQMGDARNVIESYQRGQPDRGDAWTCPTCGEAIEGQFTECWNCGTSRQPDSSAAPPSTPLSEEAIIEEPAARDIDPEAGLVPEPPDWPAGERAG